MKTIINVISFLAIILGGWAGIQKIKDEHDVLFGIGIIIGAIAIVAIIQNVGGIQDTLANVLSDVIKNLASQSQK